MAKSKTHRNLVLKINYFKGLILEYNKKYDAFIKKENELIESYYQEDMKPLTELLNGNTIIDQKREKAITRFDKKAYWNRRKYRTSLIRSKQDVDANLIIFDEKAKDNRLDFINQLNKKFPHEKLSDEALENLKLKIKKTEDDKQKALIKMHDKGERIKHQVEQKNKSNLKKIESLTKRKAIVEQKIAAFNVARDKRDEQKIKALKSTLENLKTQDIKGSNVSSKQMDHIQKEIDRIQLYKNMLTDQSIHLSIRNLKMYFGGVKAVNDLSFDVKKGEVFGLIGPNGAGKTTVFNCITQFYKATDGQMIFRNKENHVINLYKYKTHNMISEGIARSFQNVELIWELTVLDNLMVAAHSLLITTFFDHMAHTPKLLREDKVIRSKGYQILVDLGIEEYAFRSPYGLPYGVLKKVELARTLMTDPSLIILDEPAAGLNDAETEDLAKVIKKINQNYGITIFLVEHDMGLVMSICDTICAISFGKRIGLGTPKEIQNNPEVRKAYLGDDDDE